MHEHMVNKVSYSYMLYLSEKENDLFLYVCMYVRMDIYMHACVHVCMCAYISVSMYACMYICMYALHVLYIYVCLCLSSSCKETAKIKCCILFDPILYIIITTLSRYMRAGNLGASAGWRVEAPASSQYCEHNRGALWQCGCAFHWPQGTSTLNITVVFFC